MRRGTRSPIQSAARSGVLLAALAATSVPASAGDCGVDAATLARATVVSPGAALSYPAVFQAWAGVRTKDKGFHDQGDLSPAMLARHDLVIEQNAVYGYAWEGPDPTLASEVQPESRARAAQVMASYRRLNPSILLLTGLPHYDAPAGALPADSDLWLRDKNGKRVEGWKELHYWRLDLRNPTLKAQIAARAAAVMSLGLDGLFLDWWNGDKPGDPRHTLLLKLRKSLSRNTLLIANVNATLSPDAPLLNGVYLESTFPDREGEAQDWRTLRTAILYYATHLAPPRLVAAEYYRCPTGTTDLAACDADEAAHPERLPTLTALVLTHSNGYELYSDPDSLPLPDHIHKWYPIWSRKIGEPVAASVCRSDGVVERQFSNGYAYFNGSAQTAAVKPPVGYADIDGREVRKLELAPLSGALIYRRR